jgi:long-subunit fatty acid transport protein
MRKVSTLIGLTLLTLATVARAEETPPAPVVVAPGPVADAPRPRRLELGLSALAMGFGRVTSNNGIMTTTDDATAAYGLCLSISYRVVAGLSVGIAPQVIFGVTSKNNDAAASREYNGMARVAYTLPLSDALAVYAEALPGYSLKSGSRWSRGFVLAVGAGVSMDVTDRTFANIGVGYQLGYQNLILGAGATSPNREDYLRVAIGGGVRF